MKTFHPRLENKYVVGCLVVLTTSALLFQNCSPLKSQNTNTAFDLDIQDYSEKTAKLTYSHHSGTVAPEHQFTVTYDVEIANKSFKITVNKGLSATGLPTAVNKTISDSQVAQLKNLISKIKAGVCKAGEMPLGNSTESVGLFTTTTRTSPETVIYGTDCTGLSSSFYQAKSGFNELTTFLKSL